MAELIDFLQWTLSGSVWRFLGVLVLASAAASAAGSAFGAIVGLFRRG